MGIKQLQIGLEVSEQDFINTQHRKFLDDTDWMIARHIGQKAIGIETTLSDDEYIELERKRQQARDNIIIQTPS